MSRLLQGLPSEEQAHVEEILAGCATLALRVGASRGGARIPDAALLVVEEGVVLLASTRPGSSRTMALTLAGSEEVLLPPAADERLEAVEDSWLTVVSPLALTELLRIPAAAGIVADALAAALRERQETIANFASVRHVERVREKLLQLARAHGKVVPGGVRLDLPLTHELVGEMVGSARETVTWAFAQLAREGFARREGRAYRLAVSPEALAS
jgi:CRP/FNR family transcriptional regulator, cyclic AMP receptor protein